MARKMEKLIEARDSHTQRKTVTTTRTCAIWFRQRLIPSFPVYVRQVYEAPASSVQQWLCQGRTETYDPPPYASRIVYCPMTKIATIQHVVKRVRLYKASAYRVGVMFLNFLVKHTLVSKIPTHMPPGTVGSSTRFILCPFVAIDKILFCVA